MYTDGLERRHYMELQAVELAARNVVADRTPPLFRCFKVGGLRNVQIGQACFTFCLSRKRPSVVAAIDRHINGELLLGAFVVALVVLSVVVVAIATGGNLGLPGIGL